MTKSEPKRKNDRRCRTCEYGSKTNLGDCSKPITVCMYVDRMKKMRGCEAGDNCTRYKKKTGKRWNAYDGLWPCDKDVNIFEV